MVEHVDRKDLIAGVTQIGYLKLVQRVASAKTGSHAIRKRWRVECRAPNPDGSGKICYNRITVAETYLVRPQPKSHCGCQQVQTIKSKYNREYRIWTMMHVRCENPTHVAYAYYGGRGIHICERWHKTTPNGFENFLEDIGPAPSDKYSIDRIDPNGNYEKFKATGELQVKWSTAKEQRANQRSPEDIAKQKASALAKGSSST